MIDLRSDTVTQPTPAMKAAMLAAPLGDDVLGDDPTVLALQARCAELLGKPASCFVPSGTMANQAAIRAQTQPGDEIICHEGSHIFHYEGGGPAVLSGCMCRVVNSLDGTFEPSVIDGLIRPNDSHYCRSSLLVLENTHNRGGGTVWPMDQLAAVTDRARRFGLRCHLDGARLWNACATSGHAPLAYAAHFDTVSACFSKGLGAPIGSIVAGDLPTIAKVHRARKLFGGGMRQAGMLAAAALHALDHHRDRLTIDHANARELWKGLMTVPGIVPDPSQPAGPATNLVFFRVDPACGIDAPTLQDRLDALPEPARVRCFSTGPVRVRMVTHLHITQADTVKTIDSVRTAVRG
jgi:threonine aldolase